MFFPEFVTGRGGVGGVVGGVEGVVGTEGGGSDRIGDTRGGGGGGAAEIIEMRFKISGVGHETGGTMAGCSTTD